jgi:hypothetical protein
MLKVLSIIVFCLCRFVVAATVYSIPFFLYTVTKVRPKNNFHKWQTLSS